MIWGSSAKTIRPALHVTGSDVGMRGLSSLTLEAFYRRGLLDDIAAPQRAAVPPPHWMQQPLLRGGPGGHFAGIQFFHDRIATALQGRRAGTVMPFAIVRRDTDQIVGSARFWKIDRANRKLEIGHTWLSQSAQRSSINTEAKVLLLTFAFDVMQCVRVQFTTDELNEKSRAAILRIGAKQEGIVRHERIMPDGRKRNSARFSIIDIEWPEVKAMLEARLAR